MINVKVVSSKTKLNENLKMNRIPNRLENIFYSMIEFNDLLQERTSMSDSLSAVEFAREYQTIRYNPGRQCGKTTLLAKTATSSDFVITNTSNQAQEIIKKIAFFSPSYAPGPVKSYRDELSKEVVERDIDTMWVDDASLLSPDIIKAIYEKYAGKCKRFILLG
jgi:hypothetical protein